MVHKPVLLKETIGLLDPKPGMNYVDCTFGWGGHSMALLERISPDGLVVGTEWDQESLKRFKSNNKSAVSEKRLILENLNFTQIKQALEKNNINKVDGIVFDLGMSSWHIDQSKKGFTFSKDEPLDMRFDTSQELTAGQIINEGSERDLERIFDDYGEEQFARRIAKTIVQAREQKPIKTTLELVQVIDRSIPPRFLNRKLHSTVRIFQALRIAVNRELENIDKGMAEAFEILDPGGKIAVITFHSLEDRIIKNKFREWVKSGKAKLLAKKPIAPTQEEIASNPRARSAKLRGIIKLADK